MLFLTYTVMLIIYLCNNVDLVVLNSTMRLIFNRLYIDYSICRQTSFNKSISLEN